MEFRRLGKTNLKVGVIGLGTEYIWHDPLEKVEEVVLEAIENGVNYLDIFMGSPDVRDNLGIVLKKRRKDVLIAGHLGCIDIEGQYAKTRDVQISLKFIDDFYKRLQTDFIDILFLHNINEEKEFNEAFESGGEDFTDILNEKYLILKKKASNCSKCRLCEKRCPFDVSIVTNMEKAIKIFKI